MEMEEQKRTARTHVEKIARENRQAAKGEIVQSDIVDSSEEDYKE